MEDNGITFQFHKSGKKVKRKKSNTHETISKTHESTLTVPSSFTFEMNNRGCLDTDCDSEPDRSNPLWKIQSSQEFDFDENLEESSESETYIPTLWEDIMLEYEEKRQEFFTALELEKPYEAPIPICAKLSAVQYLEKHVFPILCRALQRAIFRAKQMDCLTIQKGRFNGLDFLSELLWNKNPLHPERRKKYVQIFDIPFAVIWLYHNPRPIFPLSWLWTKEEAIIVMQTYIRRYFVCKETECYEMRQFWKTLRKEGEEAKLARREKSIQQIELLFGEIFQKLIADAVFQVEWKLHGCHCVKKPCRCICKCQKWCKCCKCYKIPINYEKADAYSKIGGQRSTRS